ncbi:hypothetical protein C0584_05965 [Candidatus Parcubacteria bacterium]|nr:MAG: hypothetical protein C0584_05965 [Candidatus Parcubacteria bacterium]
MKKTSLQELQKGSAEYVIAHAEIRRARGKGPSMSFCGVLNPKKALFFAMLSKKFETEIKVEKDKPLVILKTDRFDGEHVAMLSFRNSLVVAHGGNPEKVLKKAVKRGVKRPVIVYIPTPEEKLDIQIDFS